MLNIVRNGKTEYSIRIPSSPADCEKWAAEELALFVSKSSGANLAVTSEKLSAKQIVLGEAPDGKSRISELNDTGFCLQTVGENVYVYGKTPAGTMYGVYELLHRLIGFEPYAADEIFYEKKTDISLAETDVIDNPCIEYRVIGFYNAEPKEISRRMRKMWMPKDQKPENPQDLPDDEWYHTYFSTLFAHTTFMLLPPERKDGKLVHPEWYNKEVNQLCWTNEEATDALVERLKQRIVEWKNGKMFLVGEEDNSSYCTCEKCRKDYEKYGVAGVHIRFINRIADKIEAWRKETMPEREFMLACFAYLRVKNPPVKTDPATGEYVPIDESVRLRDNVAVFNAIIDACGYHSLDCGCNRDIKERFDKWKAVSKHMLVWDYHACFDNFFTDIHDFRNYADYIRRYVEYNTKMIFCEGNGFSHMPWFADLKAYLYTKLAWNYRLDTDKLIADFFAAYFREAASEMLEYLAETEKHFDYLEKLYETLGPRGFHMSYDLAGYPDALTERHWDKKTIDRLWEILDRADRKAAAISDPETREKVLRRIKTERCALEYLYIELYTYYADEKEFNSRVERFRVHCAECGLKRLTDWPNGKTVEDCVGRWLCRYPARDREHEKQYKTK